jgi:hypothetical protein
MLNVNWSFYARLPCTRQKRSAEEIDDSVRGHLGPRADVINTAMTWAKHPTGLGEKVVHLPALVDAILDAPNVVVVLDGRVEYFTANLIKSFPGSPQQLNEKCAQIAEARHKSSIAFLDRLVDAMTTTIATSHPHLVLSPRDYRKVADVIERALHTAWRKQIAQLDLSALTIPGSEEVASILGDIVQRETLYYIGG